MKTVQVSDECWERLRGIAFSTRESLGQVVQRAAMFLPAPSGSVAEKNEKGGALKGGSVGQDRSTIQYDPSPPLYGPEDPMLDPVARNRLPRCACGHLETVHRNGKRCEAMGCDCRGFAPAEMIP